MSASVIARAKQDITCSHCHRIIKAESKHIWAHYFGRRPSEHFHLTPCSSARNNDTKEQQEAVSSLAA